MSYANGTPFLNLAQTVGTDHRDWFDENEAKLDLDTKMKTLWDERTSTTAILAALQESVASLDTDVTSLSGIVSGHTTTIATINESLVLINTALNALNTQVVNKFDSVGIADPYDAAHGIYAVGDVVTYNGQRYVCTTAVTAAEPFDVSKWTAEDIQTVIERLSEVDSYGTDEVAIGVDENGDTVYRKTYHKDKSTSDTTNVTVDAALTTSYIKELKCFRGTTFLNSQYEILPHLTRDASTGQWQGYIWPHITASGLSMSILAATMHGYDIVVEYTKA